jgi:adenylate kinase family enzyme
MKKILVIGPGGAGKSTLANQLGRLLEIEVLHLDQIYWHPGWVEMPKAEWLRTIEGLLRRDAWIMDGNYSGSLEIRFAACDTVIFMDLQRVRCMCRVLKRRLTHWNKSRPDMADGCPERLTLEFVWWIWNYTRRTKPKVVRMIESHAGEKKIVWLRSSSEVERWLKKIESDRGHPVRQRG